MIGVTLMVGIFLGLFTLGGTILFLTFRQWLKLRIDKKSQAQADLPSRLI